MAICYVNKSGSWDDEAIWSGRVPKSDDDVIFADDYYVVAIAAQVTAGNVLMAAGKLSVIGHGRFNINRLSLVGNSQIRIIPV